MPSSLTLHLRSVGLGAMRGSWAAPIVLVALLIGATDADAMAAQAETPNRESSVAVLSGSDPEVPDPPPGQTPDQTGTSPLQTQSAARDPDPTADADLCDWHLANLPWQERSRQVVYGISCRSMRWLDHLFGTEKDYPEEQVNGILLLGFEYREYDGFDLRTRFRVRAPLPNFSSRWDLIVGRENKEEFVSDTAPSDRVLYHPGLSRDEDNEWLLGLGHRRKNRHKGFDYSVGLRLGTSPNLYAKVQYYYNKQFTEKTDLEFRQTVFWRTNEGLGTTTRATVVHQASARNVVRWETIATVSEDTGGMNWYAAQTWYHQLRGKSALSLLAFVRGETDEAVPLRDYGLNLIWRQPFTRDWMLLSMGPSITWPRTYRSERRELSLGFIVWVEMEFGDYQY